MPPEIQQIMQQVLQQFPPEQMAQLAQLPYEELLDIFLGLLAQQGLEGDQAMQLAQELANMVLNQEPPGPQAPNAGQSLQNALFGGQAPGGI